MTIALDSIRFACPSCQQAHRVPAEFEGKKGSCSSCKTVLRVRSGVAELYRSRKKTTRRKAPSERRAVAEPEDDYAWSSETLQRAGQRKARRREPGPARRPTALIAALVLCGAGFAAAVTGAAVSFSGSTDALASIPQEMDVVAQVNYQQLIEQLELVPLLEEQRDTAIQSLGLDPVNDIERIYIASDLEKAERGNGDGVLILVQGDLDLWGMKSAVEGSGMQLETRDYCGVSYLVAQGMGQSLYMSALESDLVVVSTEERALQTAIDANQGATPSVLENPDVAVLIDEVRGSLVWCALSVPESGAVTEQADGMRSMVLSADHQADVLSVAASVRFASDEDASKLQAQLESAFSGLDDQLAAAPLPISADMLGDALVGKSISRDGQTLSLEVKIDSARAKQAAEGMSGSF